MIWFWLRQLVLTVFGAFPYRPEPTDDDPSPSWELLRSKDNIFRRTWLLLKLTWSLKAFDTYISGRAQMIANMIVQAREEKAKKQFHDTLRAQRRAKSPRHKKQRGSVYVEDLVVLSFVCFALWLVWG